VLGSQNKSPTIPVGLYTLFKPPMPYYVYILQSQTTQKFYVGQTDNLSARLTRHNNRELGAGRYTRKQKGPWQLVYTEEYPSRSDAMKRESQIKSWKSRKAVEKLMSTSTAAESR
jgi:putative endonuclease